MTNSPDETDFLSQSIELPCGALLKNRLVKSAMSDSLGDGKGNPTEAQIRLYERWAQGGIGLSIIGEVQVDYRFPEKPGNLVLGPHSDLKALNELTSRASIDQAHIWPQLGHAGALAHTPISQPKGPSALQIGEFQCGELSLSEVQQLPEIYARAAAQAKQVGFTGVQIHAGHGFLLSQFLSPLFNRRSDQYGGSIEARSRIIVEIIDQVRRTVGNRFPIGIKVNSSDLLEGGMTQSEALEVTRILDRTSIDLIEFSGGTYFPGAKASSDSATPGPYFIDFAHKARQLTRIPILATGGFKTLDQADLAIRDGAVDMIGLARALVLNPDQANDWIGKSDQNPVFPRFESSPPGGITAWYTMRLAAVGNDQENCFDMDIPTALALYDARDNERNQSWKRAFNL